MENLKSVQATWVKLCIGFDLFLIYFFLQPVIEDIEAILGMTVQNAEDASEVTDTSVTEADG